MTWQEARKIAAQHCARLRIPWRLDGITINVADNADADTLRFLKIEKPDITRKSQVMVNQAFAREMRKRGARVQFVPVVVADYFACLRKFDLKDSPGRRARFARWLTSPEPKPNPDKTQ